MRCLLVNYPTGLAQFNENISHIASGPILIYICALLFPQVIQVDVAQTRNHRNPSKCEDIQGLWLVRGIPIPTQSSVVPGKLWSRMVI